jgi:anhydro-N-acetylmuramic acid kinase
VSVSHAQSGSLRRLFVGVMSGTSVDGIDAVLVDAGAPRLLVLDAVHHPFDAALRAALLDLNRAGDNEIDRAARLGSELARRYASAVAEVLQKSRIPASDVSAIGCHGQTVRHRPELGYTVQIGNAALLAELCGIRVVADFRSRDVAAGGQGAPLVPAFHAGVFSNADENRAVLNLGGIANLSFLARGGAVSGFDSGPGNCLLDLWATRHLGKPFDEGGQWSAGGRPIAELLERLLDEPYFRAAPPKSTGRDLFNAAWLDARLARDYDPRSVQATLLELTARTVAQACERHGGDVSRLIVCGGGTRNLFLMRRLEALLAPAAVETSERHGIDPQLVEAAAFAWFASQAVDGKACDLRSVTGARGPRVLGAIYAA